MHRSAKKKNKIFSYLFNELYIYTYCCSFCQSIMQSINQNKYFSRDLSKSYFRKEINEFLGI